ncbi:hypothetical protein [Antricoccus suffuscus]|uniref:hypothetical protein n=1 Tax=Antricoccus suffuscus TaxID=1629062 RepID=UPI0011B281A4|nr:hypothetical protein [Antricoccus suffuscus]
MREPLLAGQVAIPIGVGRLRINHGQVGVQVVGELVTFSLNVVDRVDQIRDSFELVEGARCRYFGYPWPDDAELFGEDLVDALIGKKMRSGRATQSGDSIRRIPNRQRVGMLWSLRRSALIEKWVRRTSHDTREWFIDTCGQAAEQ